MLLHHLNSYFFTNRIHEQLVRKLAGAGHRQHVFIPVQKGECVTPPQVEGATFRVDPCFGRLDRVLWPLKMMRIRQAYERDPEKTGSSLHHAHTLFVNGLVAYWEWKRTGKPYIVTIRNTDVNQFLKKHPRIFRPIGLKVMQGASAILTLSHVYWERNIRAHYPAEIMEPLDRKHHTIPNGCEDFWFENRRDGNRRLETLRLIFVGLLARNKNLHTVLEACRLLSGMDIPYRLTVAGSGPMEEELRAQASGLPVSFLGHINDRRRLLDLYRDADLLVVPSFTESFGVVYAEAMTQGLPVIYTKGQGFDGFFPDGTVGFAIDPGDPARIADRIREIGAAYDAFADRAAKAADLFRWSRSIDALDAVYRQTASAAN